MRSIAEKQVSGGSLTGPRDFELCSKFVRGYCIFSKAKDSRKDDLSEKGEHENEDDNAHGKNQQRESIFAQT